MTSKGKGHTGAVNAGPAPKDKRPDPAEQAIIGNVKRKGEDPSPDDRARGETSSKEPSAATDR